MNWYFKIHASNMSAAAGAIWPFVRNKKAWDVINTMTIVHEEVHLKGQLLVGALTFTVLCIFMWTPWLFAFLPLISAPWVILYVLFFLVGYGYRNNPFEIQAYEVGGGREKYRPFGWFKYIWKKNPTR